MSEDFLTRRHQTEQLFSNREQIDTYTSYIINTYRAEVRDALNFYMMNHQASSRMFTADLDPEDIMQEAGYRLYMHLLSVRKKPSHPKAYLLKIAKNAYHDKLRSRTLIPTDSLEVVSTKRTGDSDYVQDEVFADPECSIEDHLVQKDDVEFITQTVATFPAIDQQVLWLAWDGKKNPEIATILGLDVWKVKRIKSIRMGMLRQQLAERENGKVINDAL